MGLRRKSRELALQYLFSLDFQGRICEGGTIDVELQRFAELFELDSRSGKAMPYAGVLIEGICAHLELIDALVRAHSHNWRLERMSTVDRNILRIAVYEIRFVEDAPPQVAINEALEIAKRYSLDDSVAFINGILDAVQAGQAQASP